MRAACCKTRSSGTHLEHLEVLSCAVAVHGIHYEPGVAVPGRARDILLRPTRHVLRVLTALASAIVADGHG